MKTESPKSIRQNVKLKTKECTKGEGHGVLYTPDPYLRS